MLDYRYETFITLVETKSYTKTAQLINFTQPAVTKHIQYIEKELDTTLVIFKDRKLLITKEGIYLYHKIKMLQHEIYDIRNHLSNQISLKIGASKTIGETIIPEKIKEFSYIYPKSTISLMVDNTSALLSLLKTRKIDIALISGPMVDDQFTKEAFFKDDIVLICSPEHPLANKEVSINQLLNETFICREPGAGLVEAITSNMEQQKEFFREFTHTKTVGSINLIKSLVKINDGVSFIYKLSVENELLTNQLALIHIKNFKNTQSFYVVKNKNQTLTKTDEHFIAILKQ